VGSVVRSRHSPSARLIFVDSQWSWVVSKMRRRLVVGDARFCCDTPLLQLPLSPSDKYFGTTRGLEQKVQRFGKTLLDQAERRVCTSHLPEHDHPHNGSRGVIRSSTHPRFARTSLNNYFTSVVQTFKVLQCGSSSGSDFRSDVWSL
jgi:hypothetical protein